MFLGLVGEFLNRPHLDGTRLCRWNTRCDLNRIVEVSCFYKVEAAELLFGFDVRAIGRGDLAVPHAYGRRGVGWLKRLANPMVARLLDAVVESIIGGHRFI